MLDHLVAHPKMGWVMIKPDKLYTHTYIYMQKNTISFHFTSIYQHEIWPHKTFNSPWPPRRCGGTVYGCETWRWSPCNSARKLCCSKGLAIWQASMSLSFFSWLVVSTHLKNISQSGWWFPINHQPVLDIRTCSLLDDAWWIHHNPDWFELLKYPNILSMSMRVTS